jgi:ubiquinone/menaquinone biosynthesis C-methylase UbiE
MAEQPSRADVRDTYERIGQHFSKTREYAWPEVEAFVDEHAEGGRGLDVGCGNGRHTELLADHVDDVVGLDASAELLAAARDRVPDRTALLQGDATRLPLTDDCVDVGVYVATLHHLPTRAARIESLDELARVLGPEGRALVSAWSTAHDRFDASADADTGFDTTVDWTLPGGDPVPRYYHVYAPAEFERDVAESDLSLDSMEVSSGNCYAVVRPEGKRP